MFRPASRVLLRTATSRPIAYNAASKRFLSSTPTQKPRSWKNAAVRWGLAAAAVYYYNTHDVFADQPAYAPAAAEADDTESLPTIEQIAAQKRQRMLENKESSTNPVQAAPAADATAEVAPGRGGQENSVEGLEAEADQQGAFNPETGEINWDCPCLGGMAHGPCGEQFKAAFSCFVYSKEEPKGVDCIEKFKDMQTCFRQYPEIYGSELEEDEDDVTADEASIANASEAKTASTAASDAPSPVSNAVAYNEKVDKAEGSGSTSEPLTKKDQV